MMKYKRLLLYDSLRSSQAVAVRGLEIVAAAASRAAVEGFLRRIFERAAAGAGVDEGAEEILGDLRLYDAPGVSDAAAGALLAMLKDGESAEKCAELISALPPGFVEGAAGGGWWTLLPALLQVEGGEALECIAEGLKCTAAAPPSTVDVGAIVARLANGCVEGGEHASRVLRCLPRTLGMEAEAEVCKVYVKRGPAEAYEGLYRAALAQGGGGELRRMITKAAKDGANVGIALLADLYETGGKGDRDIVEVVDTACRSVLEGSGADVERAHFLGCALDRAMEVGVKESVAACISLWSVPGGKVPDR